jgi:hypothetical protein
MTDERQWPQDRIDLAEEMWRQGYKAAFIAEYCDVSRNAVIGMSHRRRWVRVVEPGPQKRVLPKKVYKPIVAKPRGERAVPPRRVGKISVMELEPWHCRWPMSGTGAGTLFCGKKPEGSQVYCEEHMKLGTGPRYNPNIRVGLPP